MYKDTITVFCCQKTRDGDLWYPYILHGVNLNKDRGAVVRQYGEQSQDNAILNVRLNSDTEYTWLPPKEWQRLSDKTGYVTFAPGDFFWDGEWSGGSPIADENYGDLSFFEYMTLQFDYVYRITSVGHYSVIPHLEIAGR